MKRAQPKLIKMMRALMKITKKVQKKIITKRLRDV